MKVHTAGGALAIFIAAFCGIAHAVMLNPKGLGQVLIYPYYTVNKGQDTYVSVVNASDVGKVVRVRFLEGDNGRPALTFSLFLSAHDVWTAAISASDGTATSGAHITTSDKSCTDPVLSSPVAFSTHGFDGTPGNPPADGGLTTATRTREGHIEMIAMADIIQGSDTDLAITHVQNGYPNGGTPGRCGHLPATLPTDIVAPTSGLFGSAAVINVAGGMFYPYIADALTGFTNTPLLTPDANLDHPSLADAHTSDSATPHGATATVFTNNGRALTLDYVRGIDAVSAVFMTDALFNEFLIGAGLGANTDWVVTFPTKRFYVDHALYPDSPTAPFPEAFGQTTPGISGIDFQKTFYDREEGSHFPVMCAPLVPCDFRLFQYEANVIRFSDLTPASLQHFPSEVLGSTRALTAQLASETGWMKLDVSQYHLAGGTNPAHSGVTLNGLPTTGFMVYNIINSNAQPGRLANYGGLFPHPTSLSCASAALPGTADDPCS